MIKANFSAYSKYVTDSLYQWDQNRTLTVTGLNLTVKPEVHFSNANLGGAVVVQADMVNQIVSVPIPNSLLMDPLRIYAHIGIYEGDEFKVVELVEIPVIPRKRPADYQLAADDFELYSFKRLENMINQINETWVNKNAEQVQAYVTDWLDDHPEATTTVQDHSLTVDKMVLGTLAYITPQMYGAKGDGVADDTQALNDAAAALGSVASVLVLPAGTYRITGPVNFANKRGAKVLGAGGPVISVQSQDAVTAAFYITGYENLEISGIKFTSTRDKVGTPPSGHIRVNNTSSNIHAIFAERGDTLCCRDNAFENMESDYWIVNEENRNVTIDGWVSSGASMPMYATHLRDSVIRNAELKPAAGMGAGDHCFYISTLSENVLVENTAMEAPDDCFGNLVSFYNAHNETDETLQPKSITFRNVRARGCRLFVGNVFASLTLDNVDYGQIFGRYATSIGSDGTVGYTEIANHVSGVKNLAIRNSRVVCSTGDFFEERSGHASTAEFTETEFTVPGRLVAASMAVVLIKACEVVCKVLFNSGGGTDSLRVEVRNSKVQTSGDYLLGRRNSNRGTVLLIGNHFVCTAAAARKIVYHGGTADSTGIKFLGNFFYNYKKVVEKDSENLVMLNNYNNDTVFN